MFPKNFYKIGPRDFRNHIRRKIVRQSETTWNALCKSHFSDIYMAYGTRADKGRAGVEQETHGQPIHAVHSGGGRVRWDEGGGD